jgi:hypothetical protein
LAQEQTPWIRCFESNDSASIFTPVSTDDFSASSRASSIERQELTRQESRSGFLREAEPQPNAAGGSPGELRESPEGSSAGTAHSGGFAQRRADPDPDEFRHYWRQTRRTGNREKLSLVFELRRRFHVFPEVSSDGCLRLLSLSRFVGHFR